MGNIVKIKSLHDKLEKNQDCVYTIGNFDGVHMGHVFLLNQTIAMAKEYGKSSGVIVFNPHPVEVFHKQNQYLLSNIYDKYEEMLALGIDTIVEVDFNLVKDMTHDDFFHNIILDKINPFGLISGSNFYFGKNKSGDVSKLKILCQTYNIKYVSFDLSRYGDMDYSSTKIREYLKNGSIDKANIMLGKPFKVRATVIRGNQLARQLGFPTANLIIDSYALLKKGVYGVNVFIDNVKYNGIANFGVKPTIGSNFSNLLEVHIFDFSDDIYNKTISVEFLCFIREEKKFNSIDDLKKQIILDVNYIKDLK